MTPEHKGNRLAIEDKKRKMLNYTIYFGNQQ